LLCCGLLCCGLLCCGLLCCGLLCCGLLCCGLWRRRLAFGREPRSLGASRFLTSKVLLLRLLLHCRLPRRFSAFGLHPRGLDSSRFLTSGLLPFRVQPGGRSQRRRLAFGLGSGEFDPSSLLASGLLLRVALLRGPPRCFPALGFPSRHFEARRFLTGSLLALRVKLRCRLQRPLLAFGLEPGELDTSSLLAKGLFALRFLHCLAGVRRRRGHGLRTRSARRRRQHGGGRGAIGARDRPRPVGSLGIDGRRLRDLRRRREIRPSCAYRRLRGCPCRAFGPCRIRWRRQRGRGGVRRCNRARRQRCQRGSTGDGRIGTRRNDRCPP